MNRKNQLIYGGLLIIASILSITRSGFVTTYLFFILLAIPFASIITILLTYTFVRFDHKVKTKTIIKDEVLEYHVTLENASFLMLTPLKLHLTKERLFDNQFTKEIYALKPNETRHLKFQFRCHYRGNYNIGVETLEIGDYFGLFSLRFSDIETIKVLVFPKLFELKRLPIISLVSSESSFIKGLVNDQSDNFSDVKEYKVGDSVKDIHWKLSAKQGKLYTKKFNTVLKNDVELFLNLEKLAISDESHIILEDKMIETAVMISHFLAKRNHFTKVYYHQFTHHVDQCFNLNDFGRLYEKFAKMQYTHSNEFADLFKLRHHAREATNIFALSATYNTKVFSQLMTLKTKGNVVSFIYFDVASICQLTDSSYSVSNEALKQLEANGIKTYWINQQLDFNQLLEGGIYHGNEKMVP